MRTLALSLLFALSLTATLPADNWPQWRGPGATGVSSETGLPVERLYNLICQPFYLHRLSTVQVAVVFVAFVPAGEVQLGPEHDQAEWLAPDEAIARLSWPRSISALRDAVQVLHTGDAGPVEDVLRVY